jgi:hypothetical protein
VSCNVSHQCVSCVTGVYIASVLFLWSPVAVPAMWVVVSAPEMCCLGRNVVSLWGRTYRDGDCQWMLIGMGAGAGKCPACS